MEPLKHNNPGSSNFGLQKCRRIAGFYEPFFGTEQKPRKGRLGTAKDSWFRINITQDYGGTAYNDNNSASRGPNFSTWYRKNLKKKVLLPYGTVMDIYSV